MESTLIEPQSTTATVISPETLLKHWQGHRQLTRRLIEAFPDNAFTTYSIGGMRTFAQLTAELLAIGAPGVKGIVTGEWENMAHNQAPASKAEALQAWDEATEVINTYWPQIPVERFGEKIKAFNQYENTVISSILYFIDNEIHHRGQAYVYLRSLNVEPPAFWDRP